KPVVVLDCHSDEVGFMVEAINPNGTISFLPLGGWHAANVPAHAVVIKTFAGKYIKGVVASKPPHFMTAQEKTRLPALEELTIDIGTGSREQTRDCGIEIGNPITPDVTFVYDEKLRVMRGKAFDNRLGCSAVMSIMSSIKSTGLKVNPVGAICAQEEVGLRGAAVAANRLKPDFALIFEGSPADDTFREKSRACGIIGGGVQFRVLDAGMVSNHRVQSFARKIAEKSGIPYQVIARSGGQTNGSKYHLAQNGIPALVIGIPARYIHTHHAYASRDDFENAILLGRRILEAFDQKLIKSF
ncbi:MAG: M20/M25/M40 family metallo-hydrolase, partial [Candidatus Riflebacteria bacterium]